MSSMNFFTSKYLFRDIGLFFHAEMESSRLAGRTTRTVTSIKSLAFFQFVTNTESQCIWGGESTVSPFMSSSINGIIAPCICTVLFSLILNELLADESRILSIQIRLLLSKLMFPGQRLKRVQMGLVAENEAAEGWHVVDHEIRNR
jgi:hypothetical protein